MLERNDATDRAIIRRDANGRVDDVVISGTGPFMFRLERTDKGGWWCAIYLPSPHGHGLQHRVAFWFSRDGKRVDVTSVEDGIGCRDDTRPMPTDEEIEAEIESAATHEHRPETGEEEKQS